MATSKFAVEGLTCGVCLAALLEQLRELDGIGEAAADLVVGGATPVFVMSDLAVPIRDVREAVERAGFVLTNSDRLVPPHGAAARLLAARAFAQAPHDKRQKEGVRR